MCEREEENCRLLYELQVSLSSLSTRPAPTLTDNHHHQGPLTCVYGPAHVTQLAQHNIERVDHILSSYPQLAVVAANIVSRFYIIGSNLDRILASFNAKRPDLLSLYQVFKVEALLQIDPSTITQASVAITNNGPNTLRVRFQARIKLPAMEVFRVASFRIWDDLLSSKGQPELKEYTGPKFLVFNRANQCIKGVMEPVGSFISVQCESPHFEDTALSYWTPIKTGDPYADKSARTQMIESWPSVYIYCFPNNITINRRLLTCPPFPFRLQASERWQTIDRTYDPDAIETTITDEMPAPVLTMSNVHFSNLTAPQVDKADAIKKIHELKNISTYWMDKAIAWDSSWTGEVTYKQTTSWLSIGTGLFVLFSVVRTTIMIYKSAKKFHRSSRIQNRESTNSTRFVRGSTPVNNHLYAKVKESIPLSNVVITN